MKKHRLYTVLAAVAAFAFGAALVACQTTPGAAPQTPAQIAARVCPPTLQVLTDFKSLNGISASDLNNLETKVIPLVDQACAVGAVATTNNLQSIVDTALPLVVAIVKATSVPPDEQDKIILGVSAVQLVFDAAMSAQTGGGVTLPTVVK